MTREEEIQKAIEEEFADHLFEDESDYIMQSSKFKKGILWADEHPRKGLVDIEKACEWLSDYIKYFNFWEDGTQRDVEEFRKAMED